jgi:hypothetical protein
VCCPGGVYWYVYTGHGEQLCVVPGRVLVMVNNCVLSRGVYWYVYTGHGEQLCIRQ